MKFKIRHEQKWIIIAIFIALFLVFRLSFFLGFTIWMLLVDIAVLIISMLLFFAEQIVGTSVLVEEDMITIKYLLNKRKIAVSEISNLNIESYKRMRRRGGGAFYEDYRMRMTITLYDGKRFILTDSAMKSGFALVNPEKLPDSDVPLYMAYTVINSLIS